MKKRILMLGAGFMQGVAIRCAKERGWSVTAVDGNPFAPCRDLADRFEPIDLKDREELASFARKLQREEGLDGVFTAATDFSASVARVAEACGLPGHSFEAAMNASDKLLMRGCFGRSGVPSPAFIGIDGSNRIEIPARLDAAGLAFPLVVKPVDNMGARGCRLARNPAELEGAVSDALGYSRTGRAIVEEYMDGPEFSAEALVYDGEIHMTGLADRHIFFSPYFIEMGHTIPTAFPESDADRLVEVFKAGIRSLGLTHGVAKGDLKLTSRGPMIGEIAGRLSGGYMSGWTFPYSSGIDLTGAALELAVGNRPVSLEPAQNWTSAERAWISIPGRVSSVSGYEKARTIPYIRDVFPRAKPGDTVSFPMNNVEKCGNCLAVAPERALAIRAAEEACRCVFIRLEPANPDTSAFLESGPGLPDAFPPDAFPAGSSSPGSVEAVTVSLALPSGSVSVAVPRDLASRIDELADWQGRTLRSALLQACIVEPGLTDCLNGNDGKAVTGYWRALLRGGIQGIVYQYDTENR